MMLVLMFQSVVPTSRCGYS